MPSFLDAYARLCAFCSTQATPVAFQRQIALHSNAFLFCPLCMAGEEIAIHIVLYGPIASPPSMAWVPDPRHRDDLNKLLGILGRAFEGYYRRCRDQHTYPQIWVASGAAVDLLSMLSDSLRFSRSRPAGQRLGNLLWYPVQRYMIAGQQCLICATHALCMHWATGQQPEEDQHLGALIDWLYPPDPALFAQTIAQDELLPAGIKTDPDFDRDVLAPLLRDYHQARKGKGPAGRSGQLALQIRDALLPTATRIYKLTAFAYHTLNQAPLSPIQGLERLEAQEAEAFTAFLNLLDKGRQFPLEDTRWQAIYGISQRINAAEQMRALRSRADPFGQARARFEGENLFGCVQHVTPCSALTRRGGKGSRMPRGTHPSIEILSQQTLLRIRKQDELSWSKDPRLKVVVHSLEWVSDGVLVVLDVIKGMRAVGLPRSGEDMEFSPYQVDWERWKRERTRLAQHLVGRLPLWAQAFRPVPSLPPYDLSKAYHPFPLPADPLRLLQELEV